MFAILSLNLNRNLSLNLRPGITIKVMKKDWLTRLGTSPTEIIVRHNLMTTERGDDDSPLSMPLLKAPPVPAHESPARQSHVGVRVRLCRVAVLNLFLRGINEIAFAERRPVEPVRLIENDFVQLSLSRRPLR